jgi:hypothetical protein
MRLASVKPQDLVRCDHRRRVFWAQVTGRDGSSLSIVPVSRNISYYRVSARGVREHYARRTRDDGAVMTRAIRAEDLIAYHQDGQTVFASVIGRTRAKLRVRPIDPRAATQELHTREVTEHYARRGRRRHRESVT